MKKFFLFTLFYLEALTILAQTDSIRGRVFNSSGEPLQAATIVLQSQSDSSFLGGVLSDVSGRFVLPAQNVPTKVIVSCLGYTTSVMNVPQNKNIDVVLTEKEQLLGEVVVKGHAPTVKMTSDGFSTRVQNTVLAKAGTAADVLGQIPMLKKTSDGYEVFGKGTPVFYLNGHRVYDVSELENLKSKNLKTVELVLNPGVKYDASTKAVINLTTVQNSDEGWGVDVESNYIQNHHASFTDKVNLSYQTKRFSFYDLIKYDRNNNITWKDLRQDVYVDTLWNHNNSEKEHRYSRKIENTMGIDYQLAANSHIGAKYLIRWSLQDKMRMTNLNNVLANGEYYDQLITNGAEQNHYHPYHQLNVYYSGLISGYTVNADMDYLRSQSATDDDYEELSKDYLNRVVHSISKVKNELMSYRLSGGHKIGAGNLSAGMEYMKTNRHDDYTNLEKYVPASVSQLKEEHLSPFMEYSALTPVGYLTAGVRYEYVSLDYYSDGVKMPEQCRTDRQWFPSLSWGVKFGDLQAQLNYTTSTNRPTYRQLSSNVFYADRYTWQTGNPLLRSEYTHNITLQGMWHWLQFQLSYEDCRHAIIYWATQYTNNKDISIVSHKNLPSVKQVKAAVVISKTFGIWNPQLTLVMDRQFLHLDTQLGRRSLDNPIFFSTFNNAFKFTSTFTAFLNFSNQSPGDYRNVHLYRDVFNTSVNLVKTFLHDRLSLQLKANDLFWTQRDGNIVYSNRMNMHLLNKYDSRYVSLTVRYQLNAHKHKEHVQKEVQKEINRL